MKIEEKKNFDGLKKRKNGEDGKERGTNTK